MKTSMRSGALMIVGCASAAALLVGCGKMGDLERPGPLFGQGRNTTRASDEAVRQAQDPSRPVNTVDTRDISNDPSPPRTIPIPGTQDPMRSGPQGALPDPYANPRR
jgi:hypothetical protein